MVKWPSYNEIIDSIKLIYPDAPKIETYVQQVYRQYLQFSHQASPKLVAREIVYTYLRQIEKYYAFEIKTDRMQEMIAQFEDSNLPFQGETNENI